MEARMETVWLCSNGEVYHRSCVHWTASIESGKCERCGEEIPELTLRLARAQCADRERLVCDRDVRRSLKTLAQRFADIGKPTAGGG
jgi:hypothetical protein